MLISTHGLNSLFPAAFRATLLAASTSFAAALPAPQADLDILAIAQQVLPNSTDTLVGVEDFSTGSDSSWVATALISPAVGSNEFVLLGDPSPDGSLGAAVLRRPMNIGGQVQVRLGRPSILGGQVAYVASSNPLTNVVFESAWLDDQLLAVQGALVGSSGRTWAGLSSVTLRPGGKVFVQGWTQFGSVLYRQDTDTVLLSAGDTLATVNNPITSIERVAFSPNGEHWVARVNTGQIRDAIVLDGSLLVLGGGGVVASRPVGSIPGLVGSSWFDFGRMAVDDTGRVTFQASVDGSAFAVTTIRGDRVIEPADPSVPIRLFIGNTFGSLALFFLDDRVFLEGEQIIDASATLDANGDGLADAGYALGTTTFGQVNWQLIGSSRQIIGSALVEVPNVMGDSQAIVRFQRSLQGSDVCDGVPNSTGHPAQLEAIGRSGAAANDLTLFVVDLPTGCMGYAIASQQAGFVANPGGSTGNLCLGGAIGRATDQMFTIGDPGRAIVSLDLAALPQPVGTLPATAGAVWFYQVWHRDTCPTGPTSNFSNAVAVQFTN